MSSKLKNFSDEELRAELALRADEEEEAANNIARLRAAWVVEHVTDLLKYNVEHMFDECSDGNPCRHDHDDDTGELACIRCCLIHAGTTGHFDSSKFGLTMYISDTRD